MASYKLRFKRSAEKELREISRPHLQKVIQKIHGLAHDPRPQGVQLFKGDGRYWRMRQGDYRIIYEIDDSSKEIAVIKIGHRSEVYR